MGLQQPQPAQASSKGTKNGLVDDDTAQNTAATMCSHVGLMLAWGLTLKSVSIKALTPKCEVRLAGRNMYDMIGNEVHSTQMQDIGGIISV